MVSQLSDTSARIKAILIVAASGLVLLAVAVMFSNPDPSLRATKPPIVDSPNFGFPEDGTTTTTTASPSPNRAGSGRTGAKPVVGSTRPFFAYQVDVEVRRSYTHDAQFFIQRTDGADRKLTHQFPGSLIGVCGGTDHYLAAVSQGRELLANLRHMRDCGFGSFDVLVTDRSSKLVFKAPLTNDGGSEKVAFSPDSQQIALAHHLAPQDDAWIDIHSLKDGSRIHRFNETFPYDITWGPSGKLAYTTRTNGVGGTFTLDVVIAEPDGSERRELAPGSRPLWLNGHEIIYTGSDGLYVYDTRRQPGLLERVERRFGPSCADTEVLDAKRTVCIQGGEIWILEVDTGARTVAAAGIDGLSEIAVVTADEVVFGAKQDLIYSLVLGQKPVRIAVGKFIR